MSKRDNSHLSIEELLQAADGELSDRQLPRVRLHLKSCWQCRTRSGEIERTIADFMNARDLEPSEALPSIEGPRALLRARLGRLASQPAPKLVRPMRGPVYAGVLTAAVLVIGIVIHLTVQHVGAAWIPDTRLTPGATRPVTREDICSVLPSQDFYPIPDDLANRVFEKYKIRNPRPRSYEVDYLITPGLGGAGDIRNLWPQPYASGEWNAHVKDALEDYLHGQVCEGSVDLAAAQRDISTDWIAAYRKYFHTAHPLPRHLGFSIDEPWE